MIGGILNVAIRLDALIDIYVLDAGRIYASKADYARRTLLRGHRVAAAIADRMQPGICLPLER